MHGFNKQMLHFVVLTKNFIWFFNNDIQCSFRVDSVTGTIVWVYENYLIISPMSQIRNQGQRVIATCSILYTLTVVIFEFKGRKLDSRISPLNQNSFLQQKEIFMYQIFRGLVYVIFFLSVTKILWQKYLKTQIQFDIQFLQDSDHQILWQKCLKTQIQFDLQFYRIRTIIVGEHIAEWFVP